MSPDQIIAFFLFAVVAAVTPGPGNVLLTATGAQAGLWRGLPCLLGVSSGAAALMFAAAGSLGGLMQLHPLLLQGMRVVGAVFLLWRSEEHTSETPVTNAHLVCRLLL